MYLLNLGGTDDALVSTSYFEKHGPFKYVKKYYHIGLPEEPLLTIHGHANAIGWAGARKAANPPAEAGWIRFKFNSEDVADSICGTTPLGSVVPRRIYWDGANNQFIGPEEQSVDSRPLYRIDRENSQSFQPVEVLLGQLVVAGGRTCRSSADGTHEWKFAIPAGSTGELKLLSVANGQKEELATQKLPAGGSGLYLSINNSEEGKSKIEMQIAKGAKKEISIPRIATFTEPSVVDQRIYRAFDKENTLMDRATIEKGTRIVLKVEVTEAL